MFWDGLTLTEGQLQFLTVLLGAVAGMLGTMLREWYVKRKTPYQEKRETTQQIIDGAEKMVKVSGNMIDILEERLEEERKYFQDRMTAERTYLENELQKCKKDCEKQIQTMQEKFLELEKNMEKNNGGN